MHLDKNLKKIGGSFKTADRKWIIDVGKEGAVVNATNTAKAIASKKLQLSR